MTIARSGMTPKEIEELVNQRVKEALAAYEATRAANALEAKTQSQNGSDDDNGNGGNRNGVVELRRWFEKIETVFHISNCLEKYQVKYATCTLLNSALTWWNSHKRAIGTKAAFAMSWKELMKLMVEVYCQRNEIQKMESELWNQTVKNNDLAAYTQIFQELTMMCTNMVLEEEDRVKKFLEVSIITSKGMQGHNRSDCPKLKDQNCGNKDGNKNGVREARGKAYVLGGGDANPDLNVVKDVSYADKLADGRIFEKNTVLRGCTLGLLDRVNSYGDEVLIVQGDKGEKGEKSKLSIISCTKTQRYIKRGCPIFLAQVTKKETEDKSEKKRLEDMLTVRDFSEEELHAKFSKCDFWLSRVQFLGHEIDSEGIHVDPAKIDSIKD
nr:reverse transcriptase domain-containing protein [Tanacetum cinerariifolium]